MWVVQKEHVGPQVFVSAMGADKDARNQGATKVLKAELPTVSLTEEVSVATIWVALKVLRAEPTFASHMVVGDGAATKQGATKQHEANQGFAFGTAGERGVTLKAALVAQRGRSACASLTAVDGVASSISVRRAPKAALCTAKHTVVGSAVYLQVVAKALKGVPRCVRGMVGGNVASSTAGGFALRACMVAPTSVLPMAGESDVL